MSGRGSRESLLLCVSDLVRALCMRVADALQVATAISNAIRDAGLNLNPAVEGNVIRVPVPKPSKESRDANLKLVSKVAESAKVNIRRIRQEALDKLKKMEGAWGRQQAGRGRQLGGRRRSVGRKCVRSVGCRRRVRATVGAAHVLCRRCCIHKFVWLVRLASPPSLESRPGHVQRRGVPANEGDPSPGHHSHR